MSMLRIICIKISKLIPSYFPCTHLILACSYIQTKQKRFITKQHKVLHILRIKSKTGKLLTEDVRYERDFSPIFVSSHKLNKIFSFALLDESKVVLFYNLVLLFTRDN